MNYSFVYKNHLAIIRKQNLTFQPPVNSVMKKKAGILLGLKNYYTHNLEDAQDQSFFLSFSIAHTLIPASIDLTCRKLGQLKEKYLVHAAAWQV